MKLLCFLQVALDAQYTASVYGDDFNEEDIERRTDVSDAQRLGVSHTKEGDAHGPPCHYACPKLSRYISLLPTLMIPQNILS